MHTRKANFLLLPILVIFVITSAGCVKNIRTSSGEEVKLSILLNKADPQTLTEKQIYYRNQIDFWIKPELVNLFKRGRFNASLIHSRDEFTPGPGRYLLSVTIVEYIYSKKGRSTVSSHTMKNRYELIGESGETVLEYEDTAKSIKGWKSCAARLNNLAYRKVRETFK